MSLSIRIVMALTVLVAACPTTRAANVTTLEVGWDVTLPKSMRAALTDQAITDWHDQQAKTLEEIFEKRQASFFAFWIFTTRKAGVANDCPRLRLVVEPRMYDSGPGIGYTVEVVNLSRQPLEIRKGALFEGAFYNQFVHFAARRALDSIAERLTQILFKDDKDKFRDSLMQKVRIADGMDHLNHGQKGVLPHEFNDRIQDSYRSHFMVQYHDPATGDWKLLTARGEGKEGTPPRLRVKFDAPIGPAISLVAVKVVKFVSDAEDGISRRLDTPSDGR